MSDDISVSLKAQIALEGAGFRSTHSLGQNFIFNEDLLGEIVRLSSAAPGINVLEVGPGAGLLTCFLARAGARVLAVELDRALEPVLHRVLDGASGVQIVFADIMRANIPALIDEHFGDAPYRVISNLPYYITADFVLKMLTSQRAPDSLTLMLQSEAADRLLSHPGDENWCALAAITQFCCEGVRLLEVPRTAFTPAPHVDSALIQLTQRSVREVPPEDYSGFIAFIRRAFAMRRKTLANNLSSAGYSKQSVARALDSLGLGARVRGESLGLDQLAQVYFALKENYEHETK